MEERTFENFSLKDGKNWAKKRFREETVPWNENMHSKASGAKGTDHI